MAGSPKKRAKREAAERAKFARETVTGAIDATPPGQLLLPAPYVPVIEGDVLPPAIDPTEPTRTALKRAMRSRAQAHADKAIAVLVANMENEKLDARTRQQAANDILAWGFGKPAADIELGDGQEMIVIRKFVGAE